MLFTRFGPLNFPAAPNQHQPFCDLREELGDTCPPSLPVRCFLIHSKTACRGFKSFCPCQKRETSVCLSLFFRSNWGQASARGACRASPPKRRLWRMQRGGDGAAVGDWQGGPAAADRAGYRKRACEASSSPSFHFRHVMEDLPSLPLLYSSLSHPPPTLQHPERTRFRLFRAFPGAFSRFPLFWTCKISRPVFVYSAT